MMLTSCDIIYVFRCYRARLRGWTCTMDNTRDPIGRPCHSTWILGQHFDKHRLCNQCLHIKHQHHFHCHQGAERAGDGSDLRGEGARTNPPLLRHQPHHRQEYRKQQLWHPAQRCSQLYPTLWTWAWFHNRRSYQQHAKTTSHHEPSHGRTFCTCTWIWISGADGDNATRRTFGTWRIFGTHGAWRTNATWINNGTRRTNGTRRANGTRRPNGTWRANGTRRANGTWRTNGTWRAIGTWRTNGSRTWRTDRARKCHGTMEPFRNWDCPNSEPNSQHSCFHTKHPDNQHPSLLSNQYTNNWGGAGDDLEGGSGVANERQ